MTTRNKQQLTAVYRSLDDIRLRKETILDGIRDDGEKMQKQWNSLFRKPDALKKNQTPARRVSSFFNMGAGMVDAALLGWKLYRKFKK